MNNTLLVALREFNQRVRRRGFWIMSAALPLILVVVSLVTGGFASSPAEPIEDLMGGERPSGVIGYVDEAGLIQAVADPVPAGLFQAFPDAGAADAALARGEIDAYYVVAAGYRETGAVRRVSPRLSAMPPDTEWFNWVLVTNLFPDAGPEELARMRWPFNASAPAFVNVSADGETDGGGNTMLPFLVTLAVIMPLFTSGTLLLASLAQEKGNRIMEILLVSLRPRQLLAGKLLGLGAVTLVQYAIWAVIGLLGAAVTGRDASRLLSVVNLSPGELALVVAYALGGFTLYAALMAGIGALAPDLEGSRGWVAAVTLPMMIPIYAWQPIVTLPNGGLAVALSLVPFSAPAAMLMRMTAATVPVWQIGVSLALLVITAMGMVSLMARLFRVQTLLSGEALSIRRMWATLKG